jgi:hypothetical protein
MRRLLVGAAIAAAAIGGVVVGGTASAAQPAEQGCFGATVSANAQAFQPYGQVILAPNAPSGPLGKISDAVHAVQAGQVDDLLFPNACN